MSTEPSGLFSDTEQLKQTVQNSPLLQALAQVNPDSLRAALKEETHKAGTTLFYEGQSGDRAYLIWSGKLRIQHEVGSSEPIILRFCIPGDMVGEMALVDERPRSATVVVAEDSRLISLSRADFQGLVSEKPEVALELLAILSYRLRSSEDYLFAASRSLDYVLQRFDLASASRGGASDESMTELRLQGLGQFFENLAGSVTAISDGLGELRGQAGDLPGPYGETLETVSARAARMQTQMDRIKRLGELLSGEVPMNMKRIELGRVAQEVVDDLAPLSHLYDVSLDLSVEAEDTALRGDEAMLSDALHYLVENGMRLSPARGHVQVVVSRTLDQGLLVSIIDQGPGVPDEFKSLVFEPFVRTAGDTGEGIGMGLPTSRAIIRLHNGQIWVEDNPDGGAAFQFTLPSA